VANGSVVPRWVVLDQPFKIISYGSHSWPHCWSDDLCARAGKSLLSAFCRNTTISLEHEDHMGGRSGCLHVRPCLLGWIPLDSYSIFQLARQLDWGFGFCTVGNLLACAAVVQYAPGLPRRTFKMKMHMLRYLTGYFYPGKRELSEFGILSERYGG